MSDYIPEPVVMEILVRLPVKYLLRFRSVCKSWFSLISSTIFVNTHLHLNRTITTATPQLLIKSGTDPDVYMLCSDNDTFGDEYVELEPSFRFKKSGRIFEIMGSYNGLMCLFSSDCPSSESSIIIVLWNPSIRSLLTIPDSEVIYNKVPGLYPRFVIGFGFDRRSNDYKVVKIDYIYDNSKARNVLQRGELYALSTRSWRPICVNFCSEIYRFDGSVFLNGAVHWIAFAPYGDKPDAGISSLVAFDMGDEVFKGMALPKNLAIVRPGTNMEVKLLDGSLAVIRYEDFITDTIHIWVMEEYGVLESWAKRCTISGLEPFSRIVGFRKNGGVLYVDGDENELASYDPQSQKIKHIKFRGHGYTFYVATYMESLVALDEAK